MPTPRWAGGCPPAARLDQTPHRVTRASQSCPSPGAGEPCDQLLVSVQDLSDRGGCSYSTQRGCAQGADPAGSAQAGSSRSRHAVPALLAFAPLSSISPALAAPGEAQSTDPTHCPYPLRLRSLSLCPAGQDSTSKSGTGENIHKGSLMVPVVPFLCVSLCTGGFLSAMLQEVRGGSAAPLHPPPTGVPPRPLRGWSGGKREGSFS